MSGGAEGPEALARTTTPRREGSTSQFPALRLVLPSRTSLWNEFDGTFQEAEQPGACPIEVPLSNRAHETSLLARIENHQRLAELKRLLRHGTRDRSGRPILPFRFYDGGSFAMAAETAGLEGFVFTERKFAARHGTEASSQLLGNYFEYVRNLLRDAPNTEDASRKLSSIERSDLSVRDKYQRFIEFLRTYTDSLRLEVSELDRAAWSRSARMYHVFLRAFNPEGWREAQGLPSREDPAQGGFYRVMRELEAGTLRRSSLSALRHMGNYPIGRIGAKGNGGGSPFSIRAYQIDSQHGTSEQVSEQIAAAARAGLRTIFELVPNHTAIDSDLVEFNPQLFVHTRDKPEDTEGYYHLQSPRHGEYWIRYGGHLDEGTGKRQYFVDTLQLDLSIPETRELVIAEVKDLLQRFGLHGFRVDMAYKLLNDEFHRCWGSELRYSQRPREFLEELITAVKEQFPEVAFAAEAFANWDELSRVGFDLIYGIRDMRRLGGHHHAGWHDALISRDPEKLRAAIVRGEFLRWQRGGAAPLPFWGQHDKPSFSKTLGDDWKWGAAFLTLMRPGALSILAGSEAEFEAPCEEDGKVMSFNKPVSIDWSGTTRPFGQFLSEILSRHELMRQRLGEMEYQLLAPPDPSETWVGYIVQSVGASAKDPKILIIANPSPSRTSVTIERPDLGIPLLKISLPECGEHSFECLVLP